MKTTNDISVLDRFQKKALLEVIKTSILAEVTAKFQEIYNGAIEPVVSWYSWTVFVNLIIRKSPVLSYVIIF